MRDDWNTFESRFDNYKGRIICSIAALVIVLGILFFGFKEMLIIALAVAVGFIIGYAIDKKVSISDALRRLFK